MLNRNYAQTIAQIGYMTRPKITEGKSIDFAGAIDAYYKAKDRKQAEEDRQLNKDRRDALTNAINNDETLSDTQKALFASDPNSYASFLQGNQNLANQRAMADYNHSLNMEMQDRKDAIAREIAQIKAGGNGLVNINMNNPFDKKRLETRAKNMDENIANSQSLIDTYNKAEALLNKNSFDTGGISDILAPITTRYNKDAADFQAEVNKIVPTMRPAGSGSTSDRDMAIFEKATFGFDKPKQTNLNIIKGRRAVEENNIAKEELLAEYVTSGMGTLSDFDKEWRRYLNANPIFGDDEGNTLNKNRVSAYDWFSGKQQALDPKVQQALDAGYSMDEINAFLGR